LRATGGEPTPTRPRPKACGGPAALDRRRSLAAWDMPATRSPKGASNRVHGVRCQRVFVPEAERTEGSWGKAPPPDPRNELAWGRVRTGAARGGVGTTIKHID